MKPSLLLSTMLLCVAVEVQAEAQIVEPHLDVPLEMSITADLSFTLLWREVSESRCPERVTCVWEGEVGGIFDVLGTGQDRLSISLTRHHNGDDRATATAGDLQLRLLEVTPNPQEAAAITRTEYRARLMVAPAGEELPDAITAVQRRTWAELKHQETGP
ncbi:MAG: hypothetical protein O2782_08150 [bacterium]|nr:hypothetical protein [bacterium]